MVGNLLGKNAEIEFYTPSHNYNTRLSAKYSSSKVSNSAKKLLVNLSNQIALPLKLSKKRNSETFDSSADILELSPKKQNYLLMDWNTDPCRQTPNRLSSTWPTYIMAFAAIGLFVVPLITQVKSNLDRIKEDVEHLKIVAKKENVAVAEIRRQLRKLENLVNDLKKVEEKNRRDIMSHINEQIEILSSDKTGRTDFALESAGGRIVQLTSGTENFGISKNRLFGISLCEGQHGPKTMIQAGISPGQCWAIKGSTGGAIIKLLGTVKIDSVTVEHISKSISPTGHVDTAPKEFAVWGLANLKDRGTSLGQFIYDAAGPLVQTFRTTSTVNVPFEFVEFKVLSNHGHPDFTCVYRFRVHGILDQFPNGKKV